MPVRSSIGSYCTWSCVGARQAVNQSMLAFSIVVLMLTGLLTPVANAFEVHLSASHLDEVIVNSSLLGDGWRYNIAPKFDTHFLPFIKLRSLYSGIVQQRRKFDCRKRKTNLLHFQVVSSKNRFHGNIVCKFPYFVFINGRKCQVFHKKWPWRRLNGSIHNRHEVLIHLAPSYSCFLANRTVLSLYDIIPAHFHSCNIDILPYTVNVTVNPTTLDMSFHENLCVNNEVEVKLQLTVSCPKSLDQIVPYFINFHVESEDMSSLGSSFKRHKRQSSNRAPTFPKSQYLANVKEDQDPGLSVIVITATDPDSGEAGTLSYRMEASEDLRSQDMFVMNPSTGLIETKQVLDRETMQKHSFIIYATDKALPVTEKKSATTYLSITVDDVNDHEPVFQPSSARIIIFENRVPGQEEYIATAVDGDTGNNADLRYSILNPAPPNDAFMINPQTGSISTRRSLDREKVSSYKVLIQAMDQGELNERTSSTFTLSIIVGDENDNSPVFLKDSYVVSLREDQAPNPSKEILNVTAMDADSGDNAHITYGLSGSGHDTFAINQITGQLFLVKPLNYENTNEYVLSVSAEDRGIPSRRNSTTVLVKVIDVSNNQSIGRHKRQSSNRAPTFPKSQYTANVKEDQDPGLSVIVITATDPDSGEAGTLSYRMEASEDLRSQDMFVMNPSTGLIETKQVLDRETMQKHSFIIYATDKALPVTERKSATTYLSITVDDVNDHEPVFQPSSARIIIFENRVPGQEEYIATAVDGDTGNNADLRYSILNPAPPNDAFMINPQTGSISTRRSLDREKVSAYKVLIQAMDQGELNERKSSTFTLSIIVGDENDNSPVFLKDSYVVSLREDQAPNPSKEIINVTAMDADAGDNAYVTYRLSGSGQDLFNINQITGQLFLVKPLNYENTNEYVLSVWADDRGLPSRRNSTTVVVKVIDVNDNQPIFTESTYYRTIDENIAIGSSVIEVLAEDRDSGRNALITYSIVNTSNSFPFEIDSHNGLIKTKAKIDREALASYVFQVKAEDSGDPPLSDTASVSLTVRDVNDNAPVFQQRAYNASISEEATKGDQVVTVLAVDRDEGNNARVSYRIESGNDKEAFQIRVLQGAGVITVNRKLDAREQNRYVLTVSAQDIGGQTDSVDVTIYVLDTNRFAPKFQGDHQYFFDVSEDVSVGTSVFQVLALDDDVGENARITYSLSPMSVFAIDPNTGVISTRQALDRETVSLYALTITATDNGKPPLKDFADISVTVKDVNDNKPEFSKYKYTGSVLEDAPVGFRIVNVSAVDKDEGINGQVRYTFEGGDDGNGAFGIDNQGWIRLNKTIDREVKSSYDLVAVAVDADPIHPQSSSVVVHIDVLDVNDNSPIFESKEFVVMINENSPIGSTVAVISAVDPDAGTNALVEYTIANGGDSDKFKLAGRRDEPAIITTLVNLDYEDGKQQYEITLRAASGTLISTAKVIIKVQDVNDNIPILEDFSIIYNNYGGMFPNGPIGRIPAFDPDVSDRDRLVYRILTGNKVDLLHLNETSGEVTLDPRLNSDVPRTGTFQMSVSDGVTEVKATCRLWVRMVTMEMLHNAVTIRLNKMTQIAFMSPLLTFFVDALATIFSTDQSNIFVINIEDDVDVSAQILNVSVSVRRDSIIVQGQTKDVFYTPEYIREVIYLHRSLLASLSTLQVLPFDDNLCLVEPCTNFEACRSIVQQGLAQPFISSKTVLFRPVHPTQIFQCVCPYGFAGMNQTKMCDTEIDLCYSFPCQNNGVCLRHETGYTCQCQHGFTGTVCEYNMTTRYDSLTCPSDQCKGRSHCSPLFEGGFTCADCPNDGNRDDQCRLRTKSFSRGSYLTFPSVKARNRFTIQLKFATQDKNGLLFYNGRFNGEHDFIALEIVNSQIRFSFGLGSNDTTRVTTNVEGGVSTGEWISVKVEYISRIATVTVGDDCDTEIAIKYADKLGQYGCAVRIEHQLSNVCDNPIKDCNRLLDLTGPLQIAGLPVLPSSGQLNNQDFVGCISDFHLDHQLLDLEASIADYMTGTGCPPKELRCQSSPCKLGGKCREGWSTFLCDCPELTGGKDCSQSIERSRQINGNGYLSYSGPPQPVIRYPWFNGIAFRTRASNGVLMQILLNSGEVVIQIVNGNIQYIYLSTVLMLDGVPVDDGRWHYFEIRWYNQNTLEMFLDYGQYNRKFNISTSVMGKDITMVYVAASRNGNRPMDNYFTGCVKDVRVGNSAQSFLLEPLETNVILGCSGSRVCEPNPCGVGVCEDDWNNHSCQCPAGTTGPTCMDVCLNYNPCKNWAECRQPSDGRDSYYCECGVRQSGNYCENQAPLTCPTAWWGKPVCGPCNCAQDRGFEESCNKDNGSCSCKALHYLPPGGDTCYPCDCYRLGSKDLTCHPITGQCRCYDGVIGRRCDQCDSIFAAVTKTQKKLNDTAYMEVVTCVVSYDGCPRNHAEGVWWDQIAFGLEAVQDCPFGATGNAKRKCTQKSSWLKADLFGCTSDSFLKYEAQLQQFEAGVISPYIADYTIGLLKNVSYTTSPIYGGDIMMVYRYTNVTLNYEISQAGLDMISQQYRDFTQKLLVVLSNVTDEKYSEYWQQVGKLNGGATHLMNLFEMFVTKTLQLLPQAQSGTFEAVSDDMVLGADWINTYNFTGATIPKYDNNVKKGSVDKEASVIFPSSLFHPPTGSLTTDPDAAKAYFGYVVYRDFGKHVSMNTDSTIRRTNRPMAVNSAIFSLVVSDKENIIEGFITDPITLTLRLRLPNNRTNMHCVRWVPSPTNNKTGTWTATGCKTTTTICRVSIKSDHCEEYYVTCQCNHLSTYAVIIDVADGTALLPPIVNMEAVTYVLTSISLSLMLLSFFVLFTFRRLQCNWNSIRINLIFTIFLVDLAYVIGINKTSPELFCRLIAIALHYFYMACFAWMFVEMLHIYRILTEKQTINYGSMKFYYLLGYVIPGIIVGLAVGLYTDAYGNASFCWLSTSESFIWSFAGPVSLIIVVNIFTFLLAARTSCAEKIPVPDVGTVRFGLVAAIFLLSFLSATWVLGLLSVNFGILALHYIHAILIFIEGIFIFLVYIIFNKKVRWCVKRLYYRLKGKKVEFDENLAGTRSSVHSRSALAYHHDTTSERGVRINSIGISTTSTTSQSSKSSGPGKGDKYLQSTSSSTSTGQGHTNIPYGYELPFKENIKEEPGGMDKDGNDSDSDSDASMDRHSLELASSHSSDEDDDFDMGQRWENQVPKSKAVELAIEQLEKLKKEKERERHGINVNEEQSTEGEHSPDLRAPQPQMMLNPPDVTLSALQQPSRTVIPPTRSDSLPFNTSSLRQPSNTVQVLTHNGSISSDSE